MKNIHQTVKFPASTLLKSPLSADAKAALDTLVLAKNPSEVKKAKAAALALMSEQNKEELKSFSVELPNDILNLNMSLGSFFFDLYVIADKPPTAPLARMVWKKKSQEFAEELDKDDFELPAEIHDAAKTALFDETIWDKANVTVWVPLSTKKGDKPKKTFLFVNKVGASAFTEILNAACEAVYDTELG